VPTDRAAARPRLLIVDDDAANLKTFPFLGKAATYPR
jgi:hypothetical protein